MSSSDEKPPKIAIGLGEIVIIAGIASGMWALLYPAVNAARERSQAPPLLPLIAPFGEGAPLAFILGMPTFVCLATWISLKLFRAALPPHRKDHFPWFRPESLEIKPSVMIKLPANSRPAFASFVMAVLGATLLLTGLSHVRSDRTHRQPIITWEGPLADYVGVMFGIGWALSGVAILLGWLAMFEFRSRYKALAVIGWLLGCVNLGFSFLIYAGLYED